MSDAVAGRDFSPVPNQRDGLQPVVITLSKTQAGCVIGKGGVNINQIRQVTCILQLSARICHLGVLQIFV